MSLYACTVLSGSDSFCTEAGAYKVEFEGIKDRALLGQIRDISMTLGMSDNPVGSVSILRKRMRKDMDLFTKFLKSEGYFDAEINEKIDSSGKPWKVIFYFSNNTPFILSSVNVKFTSDQSGNIMAPDTSGIGIGLNKTYRSKNVLEGEERLLYLIKKQGFAHPAVEKREITADHKTRTVSIDFLINPGQKSFFGDTVIKGLEDVNQAFILKYIPWQKGELYDPDLLNKCYKDLINLGIFSTVLITEVKEHEGSSLPLEIEVNERKHSSVSFGVKYHTNEGPGIKLSWENRNLLHEGEKLGLYVGLSKKLSTIETLFREPAFFMKEQALNFSLKFSHEAPDAYTSDSFTSSLFVDRELTEKLDGSLGLGFKSSKIDQLGVIDRISLLFMPVHLDLDYSNDLIDPVRGGRLAITMIPYDAVSKESLVFEKGLINYRHYVKITNKPRLVLAGSITAGKIIGAKTEDIPADERFYAGGGGSIRGYPYQSVGPLADKTPLGGKALFEMSVESRLKITPRFGFVLFLDGGSAFSEKLFEQDQIIRWGTGAGLRYYTPIGPLRLDIGIPLNRRDSIDDSYQLYISIGQAF